MNAANRAQLLHEILCPDSTNKFPASGKRNLKFRCDLLNRWKWLSYSQVEDWAFWHQPLGKPAKKKFNNWEEAIEEFKRHQNTEYHKKFLLCASQLQNILHISGMEQLSLCIRYVDESTPKIRECFLQFVPVTDVSGKGLADTILEALKMWVWMQLASKDKAMMELIPYVGSSMEYRLTSPMFIP
ncbi:hypothetical protein PR048_001731 [Dryococelus australis]|uniref:Uncharacterized protein n=1 Tax=Dryococelus australis TaxID=614101 RepID=A0ABQ9II51_9NEOP|nr:hypothetical protein PR048_001731 [Dryococelus australis]